MSDLQKVFDSMNFDSNDKGMGYNSRVLIVDALNTFMRSYCAIPTLDEDGNHIGGMSGFLKSLGFAIRSFKPTRVVLVFDGKGGSQRRRRIYKDYKANRKPPTRLNRSYDMTTDEQERENMKYQLVSLVEMVECLPVSILALDNIEADDAIAYMSELVTKNGGTSIIYSTDKDFLQMVNESVKLYNPVKKKTFDVDVVLETYGVHPSNFVFYRALLGDKSDNIDGIKGAGEKTVLKYIPDLADPNTEVDLYLIEQRYIDLKKKPKLIETILKNTDIVERNLQLMNLRDVNISVDAKMKIHSKFEEKCPPLRKSDLTRLMVKSKIISNIPNYDEWITFAFTPLARYYDARP
jgi:DNA polymerase-1